MPDTAVFSPDVFTFLRRLKRNNNREWFAKNKTRYQSAIVEPALSFIGGFARLSLKNKSVLPRRCAAHPRFPVSHLSRRPLLA